MNSEHMHVSSNNIHTRHLEAKLKVKVSCLPIFYLLFRLSSKRQCNGLGMCYGWDRREVQIGFWLGNLRDEHTWKT